MNKLGQIPQFMLVLVALSLVGYALVGFFSASADYEKVTSGILQVNPRFVENENYVRIIFSDSAEKASKKAHASGDFVSTFKKEFENLTGAYDRSSFDGGDFFGKIANHEYTITFDEARKDYLLIVDGVTVRGAYGAHELHRKISLETRIK